MNKKSTRFWMTLALVVLSLLVLDQAAGARVGGGESYGGSSSYSSSSSSGGGDIGAVFMIIELLIKLCIAAPVIGIPLVFLLVVGGVYWLFFSGDSRSSKQATIRISDYSQARHTSNDMVEALKKADPKFSTPLFLDFVNLLYSRLNTERTGDLAGLACYLAPDIRSRISQQTKQTRVKEVRNVIVGSIKILKYIESDGLQKIGLTIDANYTEVTEHAELALYSRENWILARRKGVVSQGPEDIAKLACPSCGSPAELTSDGRCQYCDKLILDGSFAWMLVSVSVINRKPRVLLNLGSGNNEVGTDKPTIVANDFEQKRQAFAQRHPDFVWNNFEQRAREAFLALQSAWSSGRWEQARPYETDHLFNTHRYWIESYVSQGIANRLEDVNIVRVQPVKLEADAFFDSLTVRIWAVCLDWNEEVKTGKLISGSRTQQRAFSEYWTFIRRSDFEDKACCHKPKTCPSCGAELNISMAGVCQYCDSKVTTGKFDWVLSLIEQDEAYIG